MNGAFGGYADWRPNANARVVASILSALAPSDFEMVDGGARIDAESQDCEHVPVTD